MDNIDLTKNLDNNNPDENLTDSAEKKENVDIYKYEDVQGGMSTKNLDFGVWFVKSKKTFRQIFIFVLVIISAISWSYSIYHFAYYVAKGMKEDSKLINDMVATTIISHDYFENNSANNLSASTVSVFPLGENKYDFMVEVKNPNTKHWADFEYCFYSDTENVVCNSGFLMPSEKKNIIELSKEINSGSKNIKFTINNIGWQRINLHKFPDWNHFEDEHLNIPIENIDFKSIATSGLSDKIGYNSLTFTANNMTPYNYWSVDFNVLLKRGQKVISINKYNLQEFISGEVRNVEINWPGKLSNISEIEVTPVIDILNQDNYIDFEGGAGLEK